MELTILLAKVFGIYLIVMGVLMVVRKDYIISLKQSFPREHHFRFITGLILFIAGLFVVLTHNVWTSLPAGLVSLFGWAMTLKGLLYLVLGDRAMDKLVGIANTRGRYTVIGILSVVVGLYLANYGFWWL